mmetsp:Transcript_4565/g.10757  ORF Transcript_4565/g.10757 Transcript_4565/m.10757 type:complete len:108 (+) Transcript_4565:1441-1764(+)
MHSRRHPVPTTTLATIRVCRALVLALRRRWKPTVCLCAGVVDAACKAVAPVVEAASLGMNATLTDVLSVGRAEAATATPPAVCISGVVAAVADGEVVVVVVAGVVAV